jgi:hypothetical protein
MLGNSSEPGDGLHSGLHRIARLVRELAILSPEERNALVLLLGTEKSPVPQVPHSPEQDEDLPPALGSLCS